MLCKGHSGSGGLVVSATIGGARLSPTALPSQPPVLLQGAAWKSFQGPSTRPRPRSASREVRRGCLCYSADCPARRAHAERCRAGFSTGLRCDSGTRARISSRSSAAPERASLAMLPPFPRPSASTLAPLEVEAQFLARDSVARAREADQVDRGSGIAHLLRAFAWAALADFPFPPRCGHGVGAHAAAGWSPRDLALLIAQHQPPYRGCLVKGG